MCPQKGYSRRPKVGFSRDNNSPSISLPLYTSDLIAKIDAVKKSKEGRNANNSSDEEEEGEGPAETELPIEQEEPVEEDKV